MILPAEKLLFIPSKVPNLELKTRIISEQEGHTRSPPTTKPPFAKKLFLIFPDSLSVVTTQFLTDQFIASFCGTSFANVMRIFYAASIKNTPKVTNEISRADCVVFLCGYEGTVVGERTLTACMKVR
jgi:hypothetical protein